MIPEDELRYKVDEVDIVREDIEDLEGDILTALSDGDEDELKDLLRRSKTQVAYLRDLLEEIDELKKETYAHGGSPSKNEPRRGRTPDHREDKETAARPENYYKGHRLQDPTGTGEKPSDKTKEEGFSGKENPTPHGSIVDPAR